MCFWHTLFIITFTHQRSAYIRIPLIPSLLFCILSLVVACPCLSFFRTPLLLLAACLMLLFLCLYFNIFSTPLLSFPCRGVRCLWKVWWDLENRSSFPEKHYWNVKHRTFPHTQKNPLPAFSFHPAALYKRLENRSYYISEIKSDFLGLWWLHHNRTTYSGIKDFGKDACDCLTVLLNDAKPSSPPPPPLPPNIPILDHFLTFCNYVKQIFIENEGEIHFEIENAFLQTKTCPYIPACSLIKKSFEIQWDLIYGFVLNFICL